MAPPSPFPPLPTYSWRNFSPSPHFQYIRNIDHANVAVAHIQHGPVGFDLEWKPTFHRDHPPNPVALVQLASHDTILLIQVSAMGVFPKMLKILLENPEILKTGVGIQRDAQKLYRDWGVSMRGCVDLALLARTVDNARWKGPYSNSIGLARLVETYNGLVLGKNKRVVRSNWERRLNLAQQEYAANDASAGFRMYLKFADMMKNMETTSKTDWYTFDCIEGILHKPSGTLWFPYNPDYDPGPPPPKKENSKNKSVAERESVVTSVSCPENDIPLMATVRIRPDTGRSLFIRDHPRYNSDRGWGVGCEQLALNDIQSVNPLQHIP